jgi:multiple sugar transport system permease protein
MSAITTSAQPAKPSFLRSLRFREALSAYGFISPWIIGFLVFMGGPIVASFILSFFSWKMISPPKYIGLTNYINMFTTDDLFRNSIVVTFKYVLVAVPLAQVLSLTLAILLNQNVRLIGFWRTVFYLPAIVSGVAGAVIWKWMYDNELGVINNILLDIGIHAPHWLYDKNTALMALVIKSLWNVGVPMVIYLAALQGMPRYLYEAAEIDGAGEVAKFTTITLPMLTPVIFFNLVMGTITGIQTFAEPYVMTGGGPENATLFLGLHLYHSAFGYLKMGYASAMAWIMFIIIFVLTILQFMLANRWVYYETGAG